MSAETKCWTREALSDESGNGDIAYGAIAGLILTMIGSITFLCLMSAISYARCTEIVDVGGGVRSAIPCKYDPQPLAFGIAACLGAFGSPIGALALYMAQTRRREAAKPQPAPQLDNANIENATFQAAALAPIVTPAKPKPKRRRR